MTNAMWLLLWGAAVFYVGGLNPFLLGTVLSVVLIALVRQFSLVPTTASLPRITVADRWSVMLLVWLLVTIPLSTLPAVSLSVALVVSLLPLTYALVRLQLRNGTAWADIESALRWVAGSVAALIVLEALVKQGRPFGTFEDANAPTALWNALFFPLYLQVIYRYRTGLALAQQVGSLALLLLLMAALVLSNSLGGLLCFLGGLFLATIASGWRRVISYKALALVTVVFIPLYALGTPVVSGRDSADRMANLSSEGSFTERVEMVKSAWRIYLDHPVTGSGLGTYKILYPAVRSTEERSTTGDLAHNDYIQFLAEGGPLLLGCLLALLAITFWRLWHLAFKPPAQLDEPERLTTAGYAVALMCLLVHAVMNFIFYVLPLAMVAGAYLARVESTHLGRPSKLAEHLRDLRLPHKAVGTLLAVVVTLLGLQSLFVAWSSPACEMRACREIRQKDTPVLALANFTLAIQPSWLPARDYLIARLRDHAAQQTQPAERQKRLRLAAQETIDIIQSAPAVHYPYALLADLLLEEPSIAELIPAELPQTALELYATTLAKRPQDQTTRLALARELEKIGEGRKAFDLVNEDGMRWWDSGVVSDAQRVAMLRYMLPRAVQLGLCEDARGMAGSLGIFVPSSALALAGNAITDSAGEIPGCGLSTPLPPE